MRTILSKLWDYQAAILEIARLNKALKTYPESIRTLETEIKTIEKKLTKTKTELDENKDTQKKREEYLEMCKTNLEKYESDLMEVTNQKDYSAVLNEIDYAKKEIHNTEEELIKLFEEIEKNEKLIDEFTQVLSTKKEELDKALEDFKATNQEQIKRRDELLEVKKKLESEIPLKYLKVFYNIAKKRNGIGVATIENETCSACHMKIRPQKINEIKKHPDSLYYCENCQRILVLIPEDDNSE
ncbi:zinc ribbon domain-containing protein [Thermotomaculum hydrothermale]|uniref:zinc ribbon domain-containing protein n=1 Tax=Thermotomaculum hydrothermale TaxID=981385 RepID=UPI001916701D|nr:C4-type zinc ribbon domain-containing protein [Thermotomaculum hydrothermale]